MRDRLIALIEEAVYNCKIRTICHGCKEYGKGAHCVSNAIADHILANGVIVPPCKVGDVVYYLNFYNHLMLYKDKYYEAEVTRIVITKHGVSVIIRIRGEHTTYEIPDVEFGKTVFLTREEAEQALKGDTTND